MSASFEPPVVHGDERTPPTRYAGIAETAQSDSAAEGGHALWACSYVDLPGSRSLCPEQHARAKARGDWSVLVWKQPEGGDWVEVESERPDGRVS